MDENQDQEFENDSRSVGAGSSNNASLHENTQVDVSSESRIVGSHISNFLNQAHSPQSHEGGLIRSRGPLILETVRQMIERNNRQQSVPAQGTSEEQGEVDVDEDMLTDEHWS